MRWRGRSRWVRAGAAMTLSAAAAALFAPTMLWSLPVAAGTHAASTAITIDGRRAGQVFDGVGAISGGGGMARLLIDYPPAQRNQILNYLFGKGGADLQVLKLEIGGDAGQSDGAEPSIEHSQGVVDCQSGWEWWLAEQAVRRDPSITLMGLQWSGPGWVGAGTLWTQADIGYLIDWLNCAKSHNLTISYIGGWDENGFRVPWYKSLRSALNANGFGSVKIIAADSFPGQAYHPARTWQVAVAATQDPSFKAVLGALGAHDTCGGPTRGYDCESTATARHLGLPLWESEIGTLQKGLAAANMARVINNGYIQADIDGFIEWPLVAGAAPALPYGDRGLLFANDPQSGSYYVTKITWAIAQTTQFTAPGWRHVNGASGTIGNSGNYVAYESPNHRDWSMVAENTGSYLGQKYSSQTITVHLTGGLKAQTVNVWETNLLSDNAGTWFTERPVIHPSRGTFSYVLPRGYVVSFTSTTGQKHLQYTPPTSTPMRLPYSAAPDPSNEAWGLDTQEGAFLYEPCLGSGTGNCIEQVAGQQPVFWQAPTLGIPSPYAVVGAQVWSNYTVATSVLFTSQNGSAGLIGRFTRQATDPKLFDGYEFDLLANGAWQLLANSHSGPTVLANGSLPSGITLDTSYPISMTMNGNQISASVDGTTVVQVTSSLYPSGLAGIESNWNLVQFDGLQVTKAG